MARSQLLTRMEPDTLSAPYFLGIFLAPFFIGIFFAPFFMGIFGMGVSLVRSEYVADYASKPCAERQ